jgi:hypothetical protein
MKLVKRALGIGVVAIMVAGFTYSSVAVAQEGGPPGLQPVLGPTGGPVGPGSADEAVGPAVIGELPAGPSVGGPAVGGPVAGGPEVGGPAPGGPAPGGPAIGGPAPSGPAPGGPAIVGPAIGGGAPLEAPALVHHFVFAEKWEGYGKGHEFRMELMLFVDGTFKMLAPDHGHGRYGHHKSKMGEWVGGWHLDDDELKIEYKSHGHNVGFITVAKEGLRLRMNGRRWVDILTVK